MPKNKVNITLGFQFSKEQTTLGKKWWRTYEVVGVSYGLTDMSNSEWKTKEDILELKKYVQIITLPCPEYKHYSLRIFWMPLEELKMKIEKDMKVSPEFRKYKIYKL